MDIAYLPSAHQAYSELRPNPFGGVITKQAMIRPANIIGATVAGFYEIFCPSYPVKLFDAWADAVAWLGLPTPQATSDALRAIAYEGRECDPILAEVRAYLSANLTTVTLECAARALAVSRRRQLTQG